MGGMIKREDYPDGKMVEVAPFTGFKAGVRVIDAMMGVMSGEVESLSLQIAVAYVHGDDKKERIILISNEDFSSMFSLFEAEGFASSLESSIGKLPDKESVEYVSDIIMLIRNAVSDAQKEDRSSLN